MLIYVQIITEGHVYVSDRWEEVTMEKVHEILQGTSTASTFYVLREGLAGHWFLQDDLLKPFGDERQDLIFVWSFDLNQDLLLYSDESGHIQLPLARLRLLGSGPIQRSEFSPFELPSPPQLDFAAFPAPYQKPSRPISEGRLAFSSRILSDFANQWRHILRTSYAESTFRRLAKAVVSIATNDFRVEEVLTMQCIYFESFCVRVLDLPSWQPYECDLFSIGGTTVVLHQDLQTALNIAKDDAKQISEVMNPDDRTERRTYLLLSVRYMLVCSVDSTGTFSHTAPTTLMDGLTPPSASAIQLLLQALSPSRPPPHTPIHNLPLEIQDQILDFVSEGSIEAARLGCVLGLGPPFTWRRAVDWLRRGGPVELMLRDLDRTETTPVDSKIYFGDGFSGVSYQ